MAVVKQPAARALLHQGIALLRERDYPEAARVLAAHLAAHPRDSEALFYSGLCAANLAEDDRAVEHLERALAGGVDEAQRRQALGVLGYLFGRQEEHDLALHYFEQLLALDPESVTARSGIGYAAFARGDTGRALRMFTEALERRPQDASLRNALGYVYLEGKHDIARALQECTAALALDRTNGAIYDSLAWAYHRQGDAAQARAHIDRARQLLPHHPLVEEHYRVITGAPAPGETETGT